jgi:transposase-like protein
MGEPKKPRANVWTSEQKETVLRMMAQGATFEDIAIDTGRSVPAVRSFWFKQIPKHLRKKPPVADQKRKELAEKAQSIINWYCNAEEAGKVAQLSGQTLRNVAANYSRTMTKSTVKGIENAYAKMLKEIALDVKPNGRRYVMGSKEGRK